jgi:hypothetical protein
MSAVGTAHVMADPHGRRFLFQALRKMLLHVAARGAPKPGCRQALWRQRAAATAAPSSITASA